MGSESFHGSGGLVLAVDDEPMNLELVEEILGDAGFEVLTAGGANAALALITRHQPDCIVLDIMMPQINGFEVCARLKSGRETRFLPILMLTALTAVEGEQIPIGARVLALADAYDALTSTRAYRQNLDPFQALSLLAQETDQGQWDPQVLAALSSVVRTHLQQ